MYRLNDGPDDLTIFGLFTVAGHLSFELTTVCGALVILYENIKNEKV